MENSKFYPGDYILYKNTDYHFIAKVTKVHVFSDFAVYYDLDILHIISDTAGTLPYTMLLPWVISNVNPYAERLEGNSLLTIQVLYGIK